MREREIRRIMVKTTTLNFAISQAYGLFDIRYDYHRSKKFLGTLTSEKGVTFHKYRIDYFEVYGNVKVVYFQVYINFFEDDTFVIEGAVNYGRVGEEIE